MPDPYDDPYVGGGFADVLSPPVANNPEAARQFLDYHRGQVDKREGQVNQAEGQQQANIDRMSRILEETAASIKAARTGRSNLPLMAFGAGMLSTPGNFGQQLGGGLRSMVPAIQAGRDSDEKTSMSLANLAMGRAGLENAPLKDKMAYLRALQTGDINAMRMIESSLIRAQGAGQDPSTVKEYHEWLKDPANAGKSFPEYQKWKADLGSDRNVPALVREYREWSKDPANSGKTIEDYMKRKNATQRPAELKEFDEWRAAPGNEAKTLDDFMIAKAQRGAAGRETGTEQAKAAQALPTTLLNLQTMDDLTKEISQHPGIDNAVGKMWANVPPIPGTPKADFEAKYNQLMGGVFLNAYNSLRGAGAITEAEGLRAIHSELAGARNQSKEAFLASLEMYRAKLREYMDIARQKAGGKGAEAVANPGGKGPHEEPPMAGAKKAKDGHWYIEDAARPGKYLRVD